VPNIPVSKALHIVLYFVAAALLAITQLASKGQIVLTAPVTAILGFALSMITSVDPEVMAKKLPTSTLARIVDQRTLAAAQKTTNP
jgi:hypothetical protein